LSLSNYEVHKMMKCESCYYADEDKIEEMKKHHDNKEWDKCSEVKGSCDFPFNRDLEMSE